jgi:hypothetical protein
MKLKELVTSAPVLVLLDDNLPFRLEADGSGIATGVVLSQQNVDDNAWHPVAFLSKVLNPVEQNCEGTSICFPTFYTPPHSPPVHMYSPSSPLHYSQGPYP